MITGCSVYLSWQNYTIIWLFFYEAIHEILWGNKSNQNIGFLIKIMNDWIAIYIAIKVYILLDGFTNG